MSADYETKHFKGYDHGDWVYVTTKPDGSLWNEHEENFVTLCSPDLEELNELFEQKVGGYDGYVGRHRA